MIVSSLRCRSRLLAGCALLLGAAPAFAQSYPDRALQGDSTVVSGTVTVGRTPLRDTITVASAQAIINWNPETGPLPLPPSPAPINFLPDGREAVFQGATLGQDFVVLNRILPSTNRPISINGTVTSQIVTGFTGASPPLPTYGRGGSVWFYSPGGIIAGPTSVFNVGNLILTANDIDATGGLFSGAGAIRFRSAANSVAAVTVQAGAQINLTNAGSYFGVVAPQVTMGGTATVNGSTAYVAAEQVDMTLNGGFFSIAFLVGTDVGSALTHTGTTTGPAGTGTIAMAAMPKNTAITMLVGGTVGYTPAATAAVQNGTIVLSAGQNLVFGNIDQNGSATAANLNIGSGLFRSQVNAQATNIVAAPTGGAPLTFTGNANLTGLTSASVQVDAGQSMTVGGAFSLVSKLGGTGGAAGITVNGGTVSVAGPTLIDTSAFGPDNFAGAGGNGTGGQSRFTINGGTVTLGNTLSVRADGIGGGGTTISGNGTGGTASVTLNGGASPTVLTLTGLNHQISANGSINGQFPSVSGGNATGGTASLTINSGTMTAPELAVAATAIGGDATTGFAGASSGGTARVTIGGGRFDTATLVVNAQETQASAGTGGTAGSTTGSALAAVDVSGPGILSVGAAGGNSMTINANANKGTARLGTPVAGGNLVAGTARLTATNGGTIITDATGPSPPKPPVLVTASVLFTDNIPGAPSTSQRAGTVIVNADGGSMSLHRLDMRANALVRDFSIANDPAGPSFGGTATLSARNGGSVTVRTGEGVTPISAYATGGSTNTPALGTGGTVNGLAQGGMIAVPDGLAVDTRGYSGTTLGGTGGTINIRSTAGTAARAGSLTAGTTTLDASGQIVAGLPNGIGGAIDITSIGAGQTMTFTDLTARAGVANGAVSGSITLTADNTPITTTAPVTGIRLGTLGTLTVNAVGAAGTIAGSTGVFGFANDIVVNHTGVAPGTTSTITGPTIQLIAGRDQIHTGSVTMRGGTVTLVGRRTLGGADSAVFSTGDLELGSGLNASTNGIQFRILDATARLRGFEGGISYTNEITTPASFVVGDRVYAGIGDIDIRAGNGIDFADAGTSATGQVLLSSTTGDVRLATSGVLLATRPNGITMTATGGTARFTDLSSRASITIAGATGVVGGNASAALGMSATSSGGGVTVGNVQGTSTTVAAATNIVAGTVVGQTGAILTATGGSITATAAMAPTGSISASGSTGVDIATVTAAGPVTLAALNGAVRVATNLAATGNITATGRSIFLRSLGSLAAPSLNATAGDLDVSSVGTLTVTTPQASGAITLASTAGNLTFGVANAGAALNLSAAGTVAGTSAVAGGAIAVTGATGITIPTLVSGGTTTLNAVNGAISVATNLQSAGLVDARGQSVLLRATGGLTANALIATAGNVDVFATAPLTAASVQASVDAILGSGAILTSGAVTVGRDIALTAAGVEAGALTAPRDVRIATTGLARATGTVTATRDLIVNAGQTNFQSLNGGSVAITSGQGVLFGALASGSTVTLNAGDDAAGISVTATGNVAVTAGRNVNFGTVTAARFNVNAVQNVTTGRVTATEDIRLSSGSPAGIMATGDLTAGDDIVVSGNAVTTGNLVTTGLGPDAEGSGSAIDLQLNRVTTGTVNSAGSILLAASQPIAFTSTTSRTSTIIRSFGTITGGNSTAGTTLEIQGGSIDTGNGQASGALNYSNFNPTDNIRTGTLTGTSVAASSRGTLATGVVTALGAINLLGDLGLTVASAMSTGGAIQLIAQTSGPVTSGAVRAATDIDVRAQTGTVALTTLDASGRIVMRAGGGAMRFDRVTAAGPVGFSATGNIDFGSVIAGGDLQVQTPGTLTGTSAASAGAINLSGGAGVTVATVTATETVNLGASNGAVRVETNVAGSGVTATGRSIFLRGTGAINNGRFSASVGNVDIQSTGNLTALFTEATGDATLTSAAGSVTVDALGVNGDFVPSNATVTAATTLAVNNASVRNTLSLRSGGLTTLTGTASAQTIDVRSTDIVIGGQAQLGESGTTRQLTLTNTATRQTVIGGTGTAQGVYRLDAAELLRVRASNIAILTPLIGGPAGTAINSMRTPDVLVESFTLNGGTQLSTTGTMSIVNGGKLRITGDVQLNSMATDAGLTLRADEAVEVQGSIILRNAQGLSGRLSLTSSNIIAATPAALATFGAATTVQAISDRAGQSDLATPNDGGWLQAGGITAILLNSTLIIQNTGSATTNANRDYAGRRGFTVGAGGFTIVQAGSNPVRIAINGRQVGETTPLGAPTLGGFVTGLDMIPLIRIRGIDSQSSDIFQVPASGVLTSAQLAAAPRLFDTTSTVNGCAITSGSGCRVVPNDPIRDILQGDFGEGSVGNLLPLTLVQLREYVTPGDEPLIDEPVTGAGNDDLWSVDDTKAKCDPAKETCPA